MADLSVQPIAFESDEWRKLHHDCGSVFTSPEWLALYSDQLQCYSINSPDGQAIGGFVTYRTTVRKMNVLAQPPFCPHIALAVRNASTNPAKSTSFLKDISRCLSEFFSSRSEMVMVGLPPDYKDTQPFLWSKLTVTPKYTYRLDLTGSEEELRSQLNPKTRNLMNTYSEKLVSGEIDNWEALYKFISEVLQSRGVPHSNEILKTLIKQFPQSGNVIARAVKSDNALEAVAFVVHDSNTAWYLFGGNRRDSQHHAAGTLAMWDAIKEAKHRGLKVFDFEGSMIPEVEKFFRGFGGELTPYFTVTKISPIQKFLLSVTGFKP